jgi:hypothetical protein
MKTIHYTLPPSCIKVIGLTLIAATAAAANFGTPSPVVAILRDVYINIECLNRELFALFRA